MALKVFPNPAKDKLNIRVTGLSNTLYSCYLTDITGKVLLTRAELQTGNALQEMNLRGIAPGIYMPAGNYR